MNSPLLPFEGSQVSLDQLDHAAGGNIFSAVLGGLLGRYSAGPYYYDYDPGPVANPYGYGYGNFGYPPYEYDSAFGFPF